MVCCGVHRPRSEFDFEVAYFEYDQPYVQHLINKVAAIYQERLELIGLWHRHPGSFDQFSGTDDQTNHVYASMRPQGAISVLVNLDPDFRMTVYHVGQTYRNYQRISYEIGNERFPQELLKYRSVEDSLALMRRKCGRSEAGGTSNKNPSRISWKKYRLTLICRLPHRLWA